MTKLSVNINKVATLRNTRTVGIPSPVRLARIALEAGADGITIHPRPDARHIRPSDVEEITLLMRDFPDADFTLEGNPFFGLVDFARAARPSQCTLVPDDPDAFTSDRGWTLGGVIAPLTGAIERLKEYGASVSLFMDIDSTEIASVAEVGADGIELYTEPYAAAVAKGVGVEETLDAIATTAAAAEAHGLYVNAGHDLNLENLGPLLRRVPAIAEVSIGHALIADALEWGIAEAVGRYKEIIQNSK